MQFKSGVRRPPVPKNNGTGPQRRDTRWPYLNSSEKKEKRKNFRRTSSFPYEDQLGPTHWVPDPRIPLSGAFVGEDKLARVCWEAGLQAFINLRSQRASARFSKAAKPQLNNSDTFAQDFTKLVHPSLSLRSFKNLGRFSMGRRPRVARYFGKKNNRLQGL